MHVCIGVRHITAHHMWRALRLLVGSLSGGTVFAVASAKKTHPRRTHRPSAESTAMHLSAHRLRCCSGAAVGVLDAHARTWEGSLRRGVAPFQECWLCA